MKYLRFTTSGCKDIQIINEIFIQPISSLYQLFCLTPPLLAVSSHHCSSLTPPLLQSHPTTASVSPHQQPLLLWTCLFPPVKLTPISADQYSTLTMVSNIFPQYQDLFQACLGFPRQLSQSPGLYCRLEVKLGDSSFNFQTGTPGKFPDKRKSPSDYRRDQRRRKHPGKGINTPVNHGVGYVRILIFSPASSSPPCSITVSWSRHEWELVSYLFRPLEFYFKHILCFNF